MTCSCFTLYPLLLSHSVPSSSVQNGNYRFGEVQRMEQMGKDLEIKWWFLPQSQSFHPFPGMIVVQHWPSPSPGTESKGEGIPSQRLCELKKREQDSTRKSCSSEIH
ncbi:uncharacterized protein [Euphorbia lathyris]|uniref:uncharacterized protein isoform X1 n=1 Tax=Euphorbia lathyris TaxID=212925 RepID=UPI003313BAA8